MSADRFDACLAETLRWEGGWSNHPKDPGGATMRGVIQRVYDGYRERKGLARQIVRLIADDELQDIYRTSYWQPVAGDSLPAGVDLAVWDFGVNSGPTRAVRYLQACLGVNQDGHMGPVTIQAANRADPDELVRALCAARRKFVRQIKTYPVFGKGWERRINGIERTALAMALDAPLDPPVVAAVPDPTIDRAQATQEPARPSAAKIATTAAAAASGIATVAPQAIAPPPAVLTDSVTNISLWQSIGEQIASFCRFLLGHPVEVCVIAALVAAVWFGPRLLPHIWARQT